MTTDKTEKTDDARAEHSGPDKSRHASAPSAHTPSPDLTYRSGREGATVDRTALGGIGEREAAAERARDQGTNARHADELDISTRGDQRHVEEPRGPSNEDVHRSPAMAERLAADAAMYERSASHAPWREPSVRAAYSRPETRRRVDRPAGRPQPGASPFLSTHAIPLTLLAAGLGWLATRLSSAREPLYVGPWAREEAPPNGRIAPQDRAPDVVQRASKAIQAGGERLVERTQAVASDAADHVKELRSKVMQGASQLSERASTLSHQAYDSLGRSGAKAVKFGGEHPFAMALLSAVLGALAGMLLPSTRKENRLLGRRRDRLLRDVHDSAEQLKDGLLHGAHP